MTHRRYPIEPLVAMSGRTASSLLHRQVNGEQYRNTLANGMTPYMADKLATMVGLDPYNVWPSWGADEFAELSKPCPECGERFIPNRSDQTYCTERCYQNQYQRTWKRNRYQSDPEFRAKNVERSRQYRKEAARGIRLRGAAYRQENRERLAARRREWYQANRETVLAKQRVIDARRRGAA
jgi:ribosomal protein S27AE